MQDLTLERAKQGDMQAFEQIVEAHQKNVYNICYRMTGNAEDAADQTQETFLKLWHSLPSFEGTSSLSTWLYRIATNCCIDFLRREKKKRENVISLVPDDEDDPPPEIPDTGPLPEEQIEQKDRLERIQQAMLLLSEEHRRILILREMNQLSYDEIAEILRIEPGTVKSRISRARAELKRYLEKMELFP